MAWARRDSQPPLCTSHFKHFESDSGKAGQLILPLIEERLPTDPNRNFYDRLFTPEEVTDMVSRVVSHSLNGEVAAARVALRRIMEQLEEELSPAEYARLAGLIFAGTNAIARLLQAQQSLSNQVAEGIVEAMREAMNELGRNMGVEL
jgi:hypothetical protein